MSRPLFQKSYLVGSTKELEIPVHVEAEMVHLAGANVSVKILFGSKQETMSLNGSNSLKLKKPPYLLVVKSESGVAEVKFRPLVSEDDETKIMGPM